ncbi:hypothetical protein TYRP_003864 [Tyrophagus putrescentiae]|nr:hypothetical protein TYRP_003864 [Tyrophagus putrescentiae]
MAKKSQKRMTKSSCGQIICGTTWWVKTWGLPVNCSRLVTSCPVASWKRWKFTNLFLYILFSSIPGVQTVYYSLTVQTVLRIFYLSTFEMDIEDSVKRADDI